MKTYKHYAQNAISEKVIYNEEVNKSVEPINYPAGNSSAHFKR